MKTAALALGFEHVESAPLVRSSCPRPRPGPRRGAEGRPRQQATVDAAGRVIPLAG